MENEEITEVISNSNNGISLSSYGYDGYYAMQLDTIINNQNVLINNSNSFIENQNKTFNLLNEGFTFISFLFVVYFLYIFIKNMIRK